MNKKYKILIADDEYWVRRKLASLLDWEALGLECLEPARDGREALDRVRAEKPDILVTDINMPFLNGVELLQRVQREHPELVTFVVSGYDDFAYVRDSFLSGGINYLLKPVSREDLEGAVLKALEVIGIREDQQRKLKAAPAPLPEQQELPADTTRQIVRQAAAYIDENYCEDLNLSVLAERFNVESSYFSRIFRQEMGENLIFYITRKRIEKAQSLIAASDANLTEIAFLVGYNDYSYFNRVFKKNTGMSPREYRNSVSGEGSV